MQVLLLVALLGGFVLALRRRAERLTRLATEAPAPVSSPLAEALKEFIGVAGGVYLTLMALNEFLGLNLPNPVEFRGVSFDPLALLAVLLAVVAPWLPLPAARR
jgi:hypothetical protein